MGCVAFTSDVINLIGSFCVKEGYSPQCLNLVSHGFHRPLRISCVLKMLNQGLDIVNRNQEIYYGIRLWYEGHCGHGSVL